MFCRSVFEIHPTASSKLLAKACVKDENNVNETIIIANGKKNALNFVVEKAKPRNGKNHSI